MLEENFDEMCWSLDELQANYILLKAFSEQKESLRTEFSEKQLEYCKKILNASAEQHTENYYTNFLLIIKKLK